MGCSSTKDAGQPAAISNPPAASTSTSGDKPVVAQKAPYKVELKEGETYYWCTCGKSKNQPFCDGSHQGTKFIPKNFKFEKPTSDAYLCGCKNNKPESGPYCDGSHKNVDW